MTRKRLTAGGKTLDGRVVGVEETTERWTDVTLVDGTTFRIKVVVDEAIRSETEWDSQGNPVYAVVSRNVIRDIRAVETLKKR